MSHRLTGFLKKQSFQPSFVSLFINPFYFIRRALYQALQKEAPLLSGRLMDFGCGRKPYENLFRVSQYIGIDVEQTGHDHALSRVDVYYDGKTIPFDNAHFDAVFCGEVMEHVFNPDEILPEIRRVLKPGGQILLTVPFCWNEHEVPYDYARYSSFGITHLLQKNGFEVLRLHKTGSFVRVIFQLAALYFFELFRRWGKVGYAISLLFICPINIIGSLLLLVMPRNESLYFNSVVVAQKQVKLS